MESLVLFRLHVCQGVSKIRLKCHRWYRLFCSWLSREIRHGSRISCTKKIKGRQITMEYQKRILHKKFRGEHFSIPRSRSKRSFHLLESFIKLVVWRIFWADGREWSHSFAHHKKWAINGVLSNLHARDQNGLSSCWKADTMVFGDFFFCRTVAHGRRVGFALSNSFGTTKRQL